MLNEMVLCEELFHSPSDVAFADFHSRRPPRNLAHSQQTFPNLAAALLLPRDWGRARRGGTRAGRSIYSKPARNLMLPSARSIPASPSMPAGSILILPMSIGAPLRLAPTSGECSCPRAPGMLPLPVPERGGSIEALQSFLNLSNQNDFVLVVAWLLAALRSSGPYPLLAISGEQGSAKTVLLGAGRSQCGPCQSAPARGTRADDCGQHGHLLAFDNLSGLPA